MGVAIGLAVPAGLLVVAALAAGVRQRRGGALGVAGILLGLAAAVFGLVAGDESLAAADAPVLGWVVERRTPVLTAVAEFVSLVGGTVPTAAVGLAGAALLVRWGRRRAALAWAGTILVGSLTIRGLKLAVERPRPPEPTRLAVETTASLPSGHALMAALGIGLAVLAVLARWPARTVLRATTVLVGALLVVVIGASRVYLGVHWTTDVLAGWMLGAALAALAVAAATGSGEPTGQDPPPEGVGRAALR